MRYGIKYRAARPRNTKKPTTSVIVVMKTLDATAGSTPTRTSPSGTSVPLREGSGGEGAGEGYLEHVKRVLIVLSAITALFRKTTSHYWACGGTINEKFINVFIQPFFFDF